MLTTFSTPQWTSVKAPSANNITIHGSVNKTAGSCLWSPASLPFLGDSQLPSLLLWKLELRFHFPMKQEMFFIDFHQPPSKSKTKWCLINYYKWSGKRVPSKCGKRLQKLERSRNRAYGQRNLWGFKWGKVYKKGMEVTLCLNTKAMERGGGKTAMMRKYNEDPLLLTTSETGKGVTWCLKVLKTSCWNQKLPSWGSQLWGPESVITWTVKRNVEKAV